MSNSWFAADRNDSRSVACALAAFVVCNLQNEVEVELWSAHVAARSIIERTCLA